MYGYFLLIGRDVMSRITQYSPFNKAVSVFPSVSLTLASGDTCALKGRLENIGGVADSSTGSLSVRSVFPNLDGLCSAEERAASSFSTS